MSVGIEPSVSLVAMAITWGVWVTVSIFNQRQQLAVFKEELKLLKTIQNLLEKK